MADNFVTNAGVGGSTFLADDVGAGLLAPGVKIAFGTDGATPDYVKVAAPLPVQATTESGQISVLGTLVTPKYAVISASASGNNTVIAAVVGKTFRILSVFLSSNGTVNAKWQTGASGTDISGLAYLIANTGYVLPFNPAGWFQTGTTNTLLNLNLSAAIAVGGEITYIEV